MKTSPVGARERLAAARERLAAGDIDGAEPLFLRLARENPSPAASAGLAAVAMRRQDWAVALERWDTAAAHFPDKVQIGWRNARAHALLKLGRPHDAIAAFLEILHIEPNFPPAQRGLFNALIATGQHERGLHELDNGVFGGIDSAILLYYRSFLNCGRGRYEAARAAFRKSLERAEEPADFHSLMALLPRIHHGQAKRDMHVDILTRVEAVPPDNRLFEEFRVLRLHLLFALGDYGAYVRDIRTIDPKLLQQRPFGETLLSVADKLQNPAAAPPKVFVIGLSKTGTTSLASALTMLGMSTADWCDPISGNLIGFECARFYDALSDTPVSVEFERFAEAYPEAAFIYTTRPVAAWERSFIFHYHRVTGWPDFATMKALAPSAGKEFGGRAAEILQDLFLRYETLPDAYAAYDSRVRRYFASGASPRMLEFDIFAGDGWQKLCAFLGKAIPDKPFPQQNTAPTAASDDAGSA